MVLKFQNQLLCISELTIRCSEIQNHTSIKVQFQYWISYKVLKFQNQVYKVLKFQNQVYKVLKFQNQVYKVLKFQNQVYKVQNQFKYTKFWNFRTKYNFV